MKKKRETKVESSTMTGPVLLDQALCFAIYSAGLAFNRVYKPILDPLGLTYPQYLVMIALWEAEGQTVSELGQHLFLESNTLTPLLKRLETAGLVSRTRDKADERQVRVSLTEKGKGLLKGASCVPEQVLAATGLTVEQLTRLRGSISTLRDNLRAASDAA
ncbi:MarR family transcriptional regulator [Hyphomonas sp. WL0036]|uniref:MarR family winged helix-turn-helix transcriptional regulator n=1 Tax=Hyphomonas sediminis TaxID=2866160 RepID=UPI001C7ED71A|nr:MarR family transcriptional regulator [Hyphomonas sediminis]MBY9068052.1 MarR family transcriptional regulator [Hyphomonas sediminis]